MIEKQNPNIYCCYDIKKGLPINKSTNFYIVYLQLIIKHKPLGGKPYADFYSVIRDVFDLINAVDSEQHFQAGLTQGVQFAILRQ
ncbi:MAG TPA: hypothetical protein DIT99_09560, partial [Candidatus Latescibacteria bacterium]|nr:hypothetical protein [Candidatus Latescibacterota bacterium]